MKKLIKAIKIKYLEHKIKVFHSKYYSALTNLRYYSQKNKVVNFLSFFEDEDDIAKQSMSNYELAMFYKEKEKKAEEKLKKLKV